MNKYRDIYENAKKNTMKSEKEVDQNSKTKNFLTDQEKFKGRKKQHYQTIYQYLESQLTESSRIANQCESNFNDFQSFQTAILQKVQLLQEETNRILQDKDKQICALKIQLQNCEERIKQADELLVIKDKKLYRLEYEIQILKNATQKHEYSLKSNQINEVQKENQKLKESLNYLIQQKNQNWKSLNSSSESLNQNKMIIQRMTQQIEDLRLIVSQLEVQIKKCPKCFTLNREKQELSIAYNCLVKQHLQLTVYKQNKEKQSIKQIPHKIKENQNILRQNTQIPQLAFKGQRIRDSVDFPCRTLIDHF